MNSKEVVAALKAKREEAAAVVTACDTALAAFGGAPNTDSKGKGVKRRGGGMQAAHDAIAVKRGTATPEQRARWEKRQAAKAAKAAKSGGASLAAAATEEDTVTV